MKSLVTLAVSALMALPAAATDLRIATWNLGWHLSTAEAAAWIKACGSPFAQSADTGRWAPAASGPNTGWTLKWGRNAPIDWDIAQRPPCDVFQERGQIVPVTPASYAVRQRQIAEVLERQVQADVIAFQEVSGAASVREVLPGGGADHEVCSYEGHKVQRLAFAWRKALGPAVSCEAYWPLSLPAAASKDQPRPGLALTLRVDGKLLRLLTVHLKSSCVSPLEATQPDGRGQLDGAEPNCAVLQQQVAPLEAWVEAQSAGVDGLVVLGDFNRNLAHEDAEPASAVVRSGGKPIDPHGPGTRVRSLWREVNDGAPASSALSLLTTTCPGSPEVQALCAQAKSRPLQREEMQQVASTRELGCRNPLGLDHIAIGRTLRADDATKVALGVRGRTLAATDTKPEPLLGVSDHCPLVTRLQW